MTITLLLAAFIPTSALAGGGYIGGSYGISNLNYDTESIVYNEIATTKNAAAINFAVQQLGGDVKVSSDSSSPYSKIFAGYRVNKYFGLEVFSMQMQDYRVNVNMQASTTISTGTGSANNNVGATATGQVKGTGVATANLSGYGIRLNGFIPVTKRMDVMVGFGIASVTSEVTSQYEVSGEASYNGDLNLNIAGESYTGNINDLEPFSESTSDTNTITGISPVFALGAQYNLSKNWGVRGEAEIFGLPINGLSVITFSGGVQYMF